MPIQNYYNCVNSELNLGYNLCKFSDEVHRRAGEPASRIRVPGQNETPDLVPRLEFNIRESGFRHSELKSYEQQSSPNQSPRCWHTKCNRISEIRSRDE